MMFQPRFAGLLAAIAAMIACVALAVSGAVPMPIPLAITAMAVTVTPAAPAPAASAPLAIRATDITRPIATALTPALILSGLARRLAAVTSPGVAPSGIAPSGVTMTAIPAAAILVGGTRSIGFRARLGCFFGIFFLGFRLVDVGVGVFKHRRARLHHNGCRGCVARGQRLQPLDAKLRWY